MKNKQAFTLIELLVVVLIIGILAAVALPQYQKAVEKVRMTEAITIVRAIATANQVFRLANGRYADYNELELLGVDIPGEDYDYYTLSTRKKTKFFVYDAVGGPNKEMIAVANHLSTNTTYAIYIAQDDPNKIRCYKYGNISAIQDKLCEQLNTTGSL